MTVTTMMIVPLKIVCQRKEEQKNDFHPQEKERKKERGGSYERVHFLLFSLFAGEFARSRPGPEGKFDTKLIVWKSE